MKNFEAEIDCFNASIDGNILSSESIGFQETTQSYNSAITKRPLIVVMAENIKDVVKTIQFANKNRLPISVKGGGHDWAGRAIIDNGIQINLSRMKNIEINVSEKIAIIRGNVSTMQLIKALEIHNLIAVTGTNSEVGYIGFTLGGGYGLLSPSLGLAIDNLVSAEIVLADGTICNASEKENSDLYWAIRGGGGNFGIITAIHIRLYETKPILAGPIVFHSNDAKKVLLGYGELMNRAPKQLSVIANIMIGIDGKPFILLLPIWLGNSQQGAKYISSIKQLATPVKHQVTTIKYSKLVEMLSANIKNGLSYEVQTRWLEALNIKQIQYLLNAVNNTTSPRSTIMIQHFHGKPSNINGKQTPFSMRKPHFLLIMSAVWKANEKSNNNSHKKWVSKLSENLKEEAYRGGFINLLGPNETEQIKYAFGDNLDRLIEIKRKYNPDNQFSGIPIYES